MSWQDDLTTRLQQQGDTLVTDIGDFFASQIKQVTVRVASPQQGNLTAEQIAAGAQGGNPRAAVVASGQNASLTNANQASQISGMMSGSLMNYAMIALVVVAGFIIYKKVK